MLDLCCGMGRHARALAASGYSVIGVERDARALSVARAQGGGPVYVQCDMRDYQPKHESCDAVIVMSQSFGYFDDATNRMLLARLGAALRARGRLILDLWNPDFFHARQGPHTFELPAGRVTETKRLAGGRLFTHLDYPGGSGEDFDFQTFTPAEMVEFARPAGLTLLTSCTEFDATKPSSTDKPKIQFVLERR